MKAHKKAFFRFNAQGNRTWCCGASDCLNSFFSASKAKEVYELNEEDVLVLDPLSRQVRERLRR